MQLWCGGWLTRYEAMQDAPRKQAAARIGALVERNGGRVDIHVGRVLGVTAVCL